MIEDILIKYIGRILVIFLLTSLYGKATPFHTFAISLLQAVAVAYLVVYCAGAIYNNFLQIFQGQLLNIIGIILGLMLFFRFIPGYSFLSRIPVAFSAGTLLGLTLRTVVFTDIIGFIKASIAPLFTPGDVYVNFVNISTVVFTITILLVFIYTFPSTTKGPLRTVGKLGEIFFYGGLGGMAANAFLGYLNSAAATLAMYLTPMSDAAIFIILGIAILVIVIVLDKRGILEKYTE